MGTRGTRLPMTLSGLIIAAAALLLTFTTATSPIPLILVVFAMFGAGFGLVNAPITNTAVSGMPNAQGGAAAAITSTGRQVGTALGIALAGTITGASGSAKVGSSLVVDAHPLWWTIAAAGLAIVWLASVSNTDWAARLEQARRADARRTAAEQPDSGSGPGVGVHSTGRFRRCPGLWRLLERTCMACRGSGVRVPSEHHGR